MNLRAGLCAALWLSCATAQAHRASDAFVTLEVTGARLHGHWEIALRDLEVLAGIDADRDGALTWGELRMAEPRLAQILPGQLRVSSGGAGCALNLGPLQINDRVDGRFAWLPLEGACPEAPRTLRLDYSLLFDLDPSHRGILVLRAGAVTHGAVFAPGRTQVRLELAHPSALGLFGDYLREGVHHMWIGPDHILFLLSLLLPAVLVRRAGRWMPIERLRPAMVDVIGIVTAYTLAHSITLSLAAVGIVSVETRLVESAIALSVVLAALNNLWPVVTRRRWALAFAFGLVHGFGFAAVLGEIGLPPGMRLWALAAFNLGVELGQLAIVAALVPLAFRLRATRVYRTGVCAAGSAAIAAFGVFWLLQRLGPFGVPS